MLNIRALFFALGFFILGFQAQTAAAATPTATPTATPCGTFANTAPITIVDANHASLYPSNITVSGAGTLGSSAASMTLTLYGFSHAFPDDVGIVLVGPTGAALLVQDGAGDNPDMVNITYSLSDTGAAQLPNATAWAAGTYKPTSYYAGDNFPAPGPLTAYNNPGPGGGGSSTFASTFGGTNADGTWHLYIVDFNSPNAGSISGGWSLFFAGLPCPTPTPIEPPAIRGTVTYGNAIPASPTRFVSHTLISAAGSPPFSVFTDGLGATAGQYSFTSLGSGSYAVTPSKTGAQNGAIGSFDAARIAQNVAGTNLLTDTQLLVADVSGTNGVTSFDAAEVARWVAGFTTQVGQTGNWIFLPEGRSYVSVTTNMTGEDYSALLMGEVSGNWANNGNRPARVGPARNTSVELPRLVTPAAGEVLIPVSVEGAADKGIISYEFDLKYDVSVIQPQANPVDIAGTVSRKLSVVANTEEPGLLRVVVYGAMPIKGNGVLLNLRFTAIGAAGSVSPLTWERLVINEGDPMAVVTDGQVELSAAAPNQAEISGRLLTAMGQGVANARVTLTDTTGQSRSILSNGFGVYRFGGLQVGQTYTVSVDSKRLSFTPLTVSVTGQSASVDMIATQ